MHARSILSFAFVSAIAARAPAQIADSVASSSFVYYPAADDESRPGETVQLNVARIRSTLPIRIADKTALLAGASYELIDVHPSGESSFQLHAPALRFGAIQGIGDHWAVWGIGELGFASDFSESVGSADLLVAVTGLVSYRLNDAFTVGLGAVYDRRSGRLTPLPAVLLNWRLGERARMRGFVPAYATAEYRLADWFDAGIRGTFEGNRFHVGRFGEDNVELAYSSITVGPQLTFSPSDWVHFDVFAAAVVRRRYEFFLDDDSVAQRGLGNAIAYGIRFRFGPSQWESADAEEKAAPK